MKRYGWVILAAVAVAGSVAADAINVPQQAESLREARQRLGWVEDQVDAMEREVSARVLRIKDTHLAPLRLALDSAIAREDAATLDTVYVTDTVYVGRPDTTHTPPPDTVVVPPDTVITPPDTTPVFGSNEPAGFTAYTTRDFNVRDPADWWIGGSGRAGQAPDKFQIVQDATSPGSPPNVGRITYEPGFGGGWPPARTGFGRFSASELYVSMWFKVSANWQRHPVGVNKILYITDGSNGGGGDPMYLNLQTSGSADWIFRVHLQGPTGARNLSENLGHVRVIPGRWHKIEVILRMNSNPTASDGESHVWVDGVKTAAYTNVRWSRGDLTFDSVRWEPIWGGVGGVVSQTMYQYADRIYVSGR